MFSKKGAVVAQRSVWVAGGYQSDFSRNSQREGHDISDLVGEAVAGTLENAGVAPEQIESVHVGNAFGQLFTGQGQLGAMPATVEPALYAKPSARHEAACASGSVAISAAMTEIEAGRADCVLVIGVEQERNVRGGEATAYLGAAAWIGHEGEEARFMWPYMFSSLVDEYDRRYGIDESHLHAIAALNFAQAKDNGLAQTREWNLDSQSFTDDEEANPIVEGRLRRTDCSQITDGAVGVVLVSDRLASTFSATRRRRAGRILGWGHTTGPLSLQQKTERSRDDPYVFPHVRQAFQLACERAKIAGVLDLDGVEVHDCFSITEYMAIDHLGITGPGESWKAVENGDLCRTGATPVNPGGGLIGIGHPVGATGVRMLWDATRQVTGQAEACQVPGAKRFGTLNIGGSATTVVSFVVGAEPDD